MMSNSFRNLTVSEIGMLEQQSNFCSDWKEFYILIQDDAEKDFNTLSRIRNCSFNGIFEVTILDGNIDINASTSGDVSSKLMRRRIHNSHFFGKCRIGNCLISDCSMLSNVEISNDCVIMNCNSIVGSNSIEPCSYLNVGSECSNRMVCVYSDHANYVQTCSLILGRPENRLLKLSSCRCQHMPQWSEMENKGMFIGIGAKIFNSNITHCYIDDGSCIASSDIKYSLLLHQGNRSEQAYIQRCVLHGHCSVNQYSIVSQTIMYPHSSVSEQGKVFNSILGHDSGVGNAIWTHGRGNLAYGAKVGGNHTGRMNDQECILGEGCFFGLDTSVKFPFNMLKSPYSMIAGGTRCLNPQIIEYPFSLISDGVGSLGAGACEKARVRDHSCLKPGWILSSNPYVIERAQYKFRTRQKSKQIYSGYPVFRPYIIDLVVNSMGALQAVIDDKLNSNKDTNKVPAGIGDCAVVSESDVTKGLLAYTLCVDRYMLQGLLIILCCASGRSYGSKCLREMTGGELLKEYACSDREMLIANILHIESSLQQYEPTSEFQRNYSAYYQHVLDMSIWMSPHEDRDAISHRLGCLLAHYCKLIYGKFNISNMKKELFWSQFVYGACAASGDAPANSSSINHVLNNYKTLSCEWVQNMIRSRQRDYNKGIGIIPDYDTSHSVAPTIADNSYVVDQMGLNTTDPSVEYAIGDPVIEYAINSYKELGDEIVEICTFLTRS